ncbi:diphosphate--fructose-6-phosphate 1-phosphotransferase [Athalassotoga sp.]|uniref:diphosphate--fructose-6-phosphate 1-phosphotransferase n=1 Tax=Athalassotoga sp. TaxID=2022597 RepID=UPI003D088783
MKILVAQSGGPTAVINASLSGVIKRAKMHKHEIIGGLYGIEGILESRLIDLKMRNEEMRLLGKTPGSYLGSCRYNLPEPPNQIYDRFFDVINANKIDAFLYIGGNDSMDSVAKISMEAKRRKLPLLTGGIPKTIDNDLVQTDHCPGFPSAAKFLNVIASEFVIDSNSYSKVSICVMEIMGRDSGWLTASVKLSEEIVDGLNVITYIPEKAVTEKQILDEVSTKKGMVLVAVSEGIKNTDGKYFSSIEIKDAFGHPKLGGAGERVANIIEKIGKVKFVNPSFLQRSASHLVSEVDVKEAVMVGMDAVDALEKGKNAFFVSIERNDGNAYSSKTRIISIEGIGNKIKTMPADFDDLKLKAYVRPLIGKMPKYARRKI